MFLRDHASDAALRFVAGACSIRAATNVGALPVEEQMILNLEQAARAAVGARADALWTQGWTAPVDELIAEALAWPMGA
jgi:hypothetical protein